LRLKPTSEQPFANVEVLAPEAAESSGIKIKISDYDHLVMYPSATLEQTRVFFKKKFDGEADAYPFRLWK
jgi:hypothetical protein